MGTRALLIALDYPPVGGGISRLLESWCVDTAGVEWLVVTTSPGATRSGLRRTTPIRFTGDLIAGVRWLRQADRRIVVAGHPYVTAAAVAAAVPARASSAALAYGGEMTARSWKPRLALRAMRSADAVIAISQHCAELVEQLGVRRDRIRIVTPRLTPPWLAETVSHRGPADGLRLVAITRLNEGYKNLELLIRLCAVLKPLGVIDELTIIGDGPRLEALRDKALQLGVGDTARLPGFVPDSALADVLARAHVGLFPSRDSVAEQGVEGFGLAIHELAAAGLPVLVGRAGGAVDAAIEPWARLLDPDDLWSWVSAIEDLYSREDMRRELGQAALSWARATTPHASADEFSAALLDSTRPTNRSALR
ncbi:unannotated protein [freshwater metagenome]|uniref:Unannotated protein n=1 Tax=freshwater metagenome TaxID=449393 RepID=A0A6J7F0N4_9ZZZZ|nr:glycosyltransferase [Actinomycetota bacterium]